VFSDATIQLKVKKIDYIQKIQNLIWWKVETNRFRITDHNFYDSRHFCWV